MSTEQKKRMITVGQLERDLGAMVRTIEVLRLRLPDALGAIGGAGRVQSGFAERSGDTGFGDGAPGSSVESVVMRAAEAERDGYRIGLHVSFVARELHQLVELAQRWNPAGRDLAVCTGGDPSSWGDPSCGDFVEYTIRPDGSRYERVLCPKHRKRRDRWRRENDLVELSD